MANLFLSKQSKQAPFDAKKMLDGFKTVPEKDRKDYIHDQLDELFNMSSVEQEQFFSAVAARTSDINSRLDNLLKKIQVLTKKD
ncbi:hypothetical protein [Flexithrix dorotheae]|uniref:hypothetical protein n=1 Tax=Flexithrix dorotheae TaxID=70993 RepID=UPI00036C567F|nr:hypothetical protein [Flexithrix dorotheae]